MSAIPIVRIENNIIIFDHEAFTRIINHEKIGNKKICIISIAGCFRTGKSFLLNFLLRYLQNKGDSNKNWISSRSVWQNNYFSSFLTSGTDSSAEESNSQPLNGFKWQGGEDPTTEGILIWSEPYILKEVAVLLMDTQGSYNVFDTLKQNADIFAISTLLSSVQIFNASEQITELDLQALKMFTSYARCYDKEKGKPFQKLVYLIRDFKFDIGVEDGYGLKVGSDHWNKRQSNKTQEDIKSWFESFDCYVMPPAGKEVNMNSFRGCLHEIKEEKFRKHISLFTEWIFSPNNLFVKKVMGESLSNTELIKLFKEYYIIFKDRKIPNPTSLMEAHLKTIYERIEHKCIDTLDSIFKPYNADVQEKVEEFYLKKEESKNSAFNKYDEEFPTVDPEVKEKYRQMLEIKILIRLDDYNRLFMMSLQNDKDKLKGLAENYTKTNDDLSQQLRQEKEALVKEIQSRKALKKEKEEIIRNKEKIIIDLEKNEARLKDENEKITDKNKKTIQEKEEIIETTQRLEKQFRDEEREVIEERIKIFEARDVEENAKTCIRSMTAYVKNESSCILHLIEFKILDGVWLHSPPYTLLKNDSVKWASSSNGIFVLNTSGQVKYKCRKCDTEITFFWKIPFFSRNQQTAVSSNTFKHSVSCSGGDGSKVFALYTIRGTQECR